MNFWLSLKYEINCQQKEKWLIMKKSNKKAFLAEYLEKPIEPYQLFARDLPKLAEHYYSKKDYSKRVRIIVNGETEFGKSIIAKKKQKYINTLENLKKYPYATFLIYNWCPGSVCDHKYQITEMPQSDSEFAAEFSELKSIIDCFSKETKVDDKELYIIGKKMTATEKNLSILEKICWEKLSEACKKKFDQNISAYKRHLESDAENLCLSNSETVEEIHAVQAELKQRKVNSFIGYIHTGGVRKTPKHFEAYLISQDRIIHSPWWTGSSTGYLTAHDLPERYDGNLSGFLPGNMESYCNDFPLLQRDEFSCGTLSVLNVKELLKENQKQLNQYTLKFSFYNDEGTLTRFFLTSPQTLRYSQSSKYITLLYQMVTQSELVEAKGKGGSNFFIKTIEQALKDSIEQARKKKKKAFQFSKQSNEADAVIEENKEILTMLPKFREEWSKYYEEMQEKRDKMNGEDGNLYLLYRTEKYRKLVEEEKNGFIVSERLTLDSKFCGVQDPQKESDQLALSGEIKQSPEQEYVRTDEKIKDKTTDDSKTSEIYPITRNSLLQTKEKTSPKTVTLPSSSSARDEEKLESLKIKYADNLRASYVRLVKIRDSSTGKKKIFYQKKCDQVIKNMQNAKIADEKSNGREWNLYLGNNLDGFIILVNKVMNEFRKNDESWHFWTEVSETLTRVIRDSSKILDLAQPTSMCSRICTFFSMASRIGDPSTPGGENRSIPNSH